ncbi:hypothetical protein [Paraburkholderia diazotrophica]|uniref:GMC oxidoreductase n=1 Tax=Paraburkholderia diazotrophica TaxID=667676 RepID=A0A1H7C6E8_9BURK|nr:hypothetical protein [Paraburkholderia diazotrophica]SEJ84167.1 hypothetical protein SAMN05192539_102040 [Paraburkholderia diazotrophica]
MLGYLRQDSSIPVDIQDSEFTKDLLGHYLCSTYDEAVNNGGRPFDVVVIGAGMFGAYAADKIYRAGTDQNLRILLLDAGGYLVFTHVQNLPHLGLNPPDAALVTRNEQDPKRRLGHSLAQQPALTGLAYCPGGRSLFWGGWAPALTAADLGEWPKNARDFLNANYADVELEIGVQDKADFRSRPLNAALNTQLKSMTTGANPIIPSVTVDVVDEPPIAVQASARHCHAVYMNRTAGFPVPPGRTTATTHFRSMFASSNRLTGHRGPLSLPPPTCIDGSLNLASVLNTGLRHLPGDFRCAKAYLAPDCHLVLEAFAVIGLVTVFGAAGMMAAHPYSNECLSSSAASTTDKSAQRLQRRAFGSAPLN